MDGTLLRWLWAFLALSPGAAEADSVNGEWYSSTRALSMGNVGIAGSDDPSTAAFYNPAGLARVKKPVLEIFNPQVALGGGVFSASQSITDWPKHSSFTKVQPLLKAHPGTPSSAGFGIFPNLSAQNFSFGILLSGQIESYYDKGRDVYVYHSRRLLIPSLGMSAALLGTRLRLGVAVRPVTITESNVVNLGSSSSTATALDYSRGGFGVGLDAGALFTLPWSALPSFGFVARNIGDLAFFQAPLVKIGGGGTARHEKIKMKYDGGFSLTPKLGQRDELHFAIDYRDILDSSKAGLIRKLNSGFELGVARRFFLRAGFSQAYWTAGIGLASKFGAFDLGSYGEELDPRGTNVFQDRRYLVRFLRRF